MKDFLMPLMVLILIIEVWWLATFFMPQKKVLPLLDYSDTTTLRH